MPIYEYRCDKCGLEKEYLQKLGAPAISACPCGESTMTKLISAAGFQLKGSGWYATDFKGGGKAAAPKADAAGGGTETKAAEPASGTSGAAGPSPAST